VLFVRLLAVAQCRRKPGDIAFGGVELPGDLLELRAQDPRGVAAAANFAGEFVGL
jgi:hypothetical protein